MTIELLLILVTGGMALCIAFVMDRQSDSKERSAPLGKRPVQELTPIRLRSIDPGKNEELESSLVDRVSPHLTQRPLVDPAVVSNPQEGRIMNLAALEGRLERSPNDVELINIIAYSHYSSRSLDKAIELFDRGLRLKSGDPTMSFYLADALFLKGQIPEAETMWNLIASNDDAGKIKIKAQERLRRLEVARPGSPGI